MCIDLISDHHHVSLVSNLKLTSSKKGNVFFSPGSSKEMESEDLAPLLNRIWCESFSTSSELRGTNKTIAPSPSMSRPPEIDDDDFNNPAAGDEDDGDLSGGSDDDGFPTITPTRPPKEHNDSWYSPGNHHDGKWSSKGNKSNKSSKSWHGHWSKSNKSSKAHWSGDGWWLGVALWGASAGATFFR